MRVPISPQDIKSGSGILRIAKCLKRDWPVTPPIGLSAAQNLISRCLGYVDYHDARMSAKKLELGFLSLEGLRHQAVNTLHLQVKKSDPGEDVSPEKLKEIVDNLPFGILGFFQNLHELSKLSNRPFSETFLRQAVEITKYYLGNIAPTPTLNLSALGHTPSFTTKNYINHAIGSDYNDSTCHGDALSHRPKIV